MDVRDLQLLICKLFCQGHSPRAISKILKNEYGIDCNQQQIYPKLRAGCNNGFITYTPPADYALAEALMERYKGVLEGVYVAAGPTIEGVAERASRLLDRLIRETHAKKARDASLANDKGVHLGLSGGYSLRVLSECFARYLIQTFDKGDHDQTKLYGQFPDTLHMHAMVAGFDPLDPTTEPNAMFTHLHLENKVPVRMKFVGLNASPVVRRDQLDAFTRLPHVKTSFEEADKIEIAITSMGIWDDPYCMLRKCMEQYPKDYQTLKDAKVIGDLMWQPLGPTEPINGITDLKTVSVMDLLGLNWLIKRGGKVVLVVGRTRKLESKAHVLRQLLAYKRPLISHLVVDSMTAGELLNG